MKLNNKKTDLNQSVESQSGEKPTIILIHGIYFHGALMKYMQLKLQQRGYTVLAFSYKSVTQPLAENAKQLVEFVRTNCQPEDVVHFVGHSLGGLLARQAYELAPELFTGRIVTLGTPHQGSAMARVMQTIHKRIIGGAFFQALDGDLPDWQGQVALGSIAGSMPVGPGVLVVRFDETSDGTVALSETQLANQADHLVLPMSHTGLVYSKRAVAQVDYFLRHGKFDHNAVQ
ncbi:esterase/lipase family protein [Ostreibacterium oceani]|uniref:Alpha/beta fold hydrolase n=1 Tax=Ostreibacterium oceani TaxID=2654998 RepID=A0A6N7EWH6_9GAMM|nr:alpha/beta fold hydrolase [Ostreibacterium oceani]MPV85900.1 alpha/beta fold hydrolase [Ostreibacterium oceani]